jgi:hypothetical protein
MKFTEAAPLIGFFGTSTPEAIYSIGQVVVDSGCTVTADPNVTPIENINHDDSSGLNGWNKATGLDTTSTIYVAAATTLVMFLVIGLAVGGAYYYKKKNKESTQIMHRASI